VTYSTVKTHQIVRVRERERECRWGSTTATTATSSSKTPHMLGNAISRVSTTLEPRLSGSIRSSSKVSVFFFFCSFSFPLLSYQPNINIFRPFIYDAKLFLIADVNQAYTEGFGKGVCNRFVKTVSSSKSLSNCNFL